MTIVTNYSQPGEGDDPESLEQTEIVVAAAAGAGDRLDRFLARSLPDVSRTRIQQWIALGAVTCEERLLQSKTRLTGRETLHVKPLPREADTAFVPDPVAFEVLAEDRSLAVINKPVGLVVHPGPGNWRNTLMNGLLFRDPQAALLPRAGIVHRLDKDTSGLLVVARSESAMTSLTRELAARTMGREYLALVQGLTPACGVIDAPIGRDERNRTRMAVVAAPGGKAARTRYRRLATGTWEGTVISAVLCALETGRTHQIRVHLAHLGHPLVGDATYGGATSLMHRQALHAVRLRLIHPDTAETMTYTSDLPTDLREAMHRAGIEPDLPLAAFDPPGTEPVERKRQ